MTNEHQEPRQRTLLEGTRVYLSGPMDFVASRREEMKYGWRTRVGDALADVGLYRAVSYTDLSERKPRRRGGRKTRRSSWRPKAPWT